MKDRPLAPREAEGAGTLLTALIVVLLIIDMLFLGAERFASGQLLIPELIGTLLSPIIFTLIVLGIARLFKRARTRRGTAKVAVWTLALIAVGSCGGLVSAVTKGTTAEQSAAELARLNAADASKGLPIQVDSVTQLVAVAAVGDTLDSKLQIRNITAADLDSTSVDAFRTQLITHDCGNAGLRDHLLAKGVVIRYRYVDAADAPLTSIELTQAVCSGVR